MRRRNLHNHQSRSSVSGESLRIRQTSRQASHRENPSSRLWNRGRTCDQQTREEVADATQKVKDKSKELGQQAKAAAQKAEEKAKAVAQGVKEGWNRDGQPIDLNSASEAQLRDLPGMSEDDVRRIAGGRPYKTPHELVARGILTEDQYRRLKDSVTAN